MANKHLFISFSFFFILNDLKHYGNTNLSFTKHFCIEKAKEFKEKTRFFFFLFPSYNYFFPSYNPFIFRAHNFIFYSFKKI